MTKSPITLAAAPYTSIVELDLPTFLMHDQPTTCPICGRRTEWVGENPQIHVCHCGYRFLVEEDEDFGLVELEKGWTVYSEAQ